MPDLFSVEVNPGRCELPPAFKKTKATSVLPYIRHSGTGRPQLPKESESGLPKTPISFEQADSVTEQTSTLDLVRTILEASNDINAALAELSIRAAIVDEAIVPGSPTKP